MRLRVETRSPLTSVQMIDWFHSLGYAVYDVRNLGSDGSSHSHHYTLEASDETAKKILRELPGKSRNILSISHPRTATSIERPDLARHGNSPK